MKTKNLRTGMKVRFRGSKTETIYKIIGRDPEMNRRFVVGHDEDEDGSGYRVTIHYVHETALERA